MILVKGILGGLAALLLTWSLILALYFRTSAPKMEGKLGATAGGWSYLLQLPWVVLLLSAAFGLGLYAVVRWAAVH